MLTKQQIDRMYQLVETFDNMFLALYGKELSLDWRVTPELKFVFDTYKSSSNISKSELLKEIIETTSIIRATYDKERNAFKTETKEWLQNENIPQLIYDKYFVLLLRMREYYSQGKWYEYYWNGRRGQGEMKIVADSVEEATQYAESLSPHWKLHRHIANTTISVSSYEFPHATDNNREQQVRECRRMRINIDEVF